MASLFLNNDPRFLLENGDLHFITSFPNSPPEADKRFDTIRNFVALRENPGDLLGQDLLEKMKAQLKANKQDQTEEKPAV